MAVTTKTKPADKPKLSDGATGFGGGVDHQIGDHIATVNSVEDGGINKFNPTKKQLVYTFELDDGNTVKLWVNNAFGEGPSGPAKNARLISALTGIPLSKPRLLAAALDEGLEGCKLGVMTDLNDAGYPRIVDFYPADGSAVEIAYEDSERFEF